MRIQDDQLSAGKNNFTLVRLILASSVIYTHCYWMVSGISERDDLSFIFGDPVSVYAVDGFFFLSGFLVYPSLLRLKSAKDFMLARLARLWPGLAVSVVGTALVGFAISSRQDVSYFAGDTAQFIALNLSLMGTAYNLTGVSCGAEPCAVNGSLWTLPWEARCYIVLALLWIVGLARPAMMKRLILPATLIGAIAWHTPVVHDMATTVLGRGVMINLDDLDRLWPAFALGVAAWLFRDRLPLSWWLLGLLFVINLAAHKIGLGLHFRALFIGYAVLCLGLLTGRGGAISANWPDYSYGAYIYAFPIMIALHYGVGISSYVQLALANFALTLILAVMSWHFVERPALDAYRRRRRTKALTAARP